MKKNVKYLGMAAAALLAVAPVVSTGVASAAVNVPVASTPSETNATNLSLSLSVTNVAQLKDGYSASAVNAMLSGKLGNNEAQVSASTKAHVFQADANGNPTGDEVNTLKENTPYVVVAKNIVFSGLKANTQYTLTGAYGNVASDSLKTAVNGTQLGINGDIQAKSAVFTIGQGNGFFVEAGTNKVVNSYPVNFAGNNSVNGLVTAIQKAVTPKNTNANLVSTNDLTADVTAALKAAGINVPSNTAALATPAYNFTVNYVAHFSNGTTATLPVTVVVNGADAGDTTAPAFYHDNTRVNGSYDMSIEKNAAFDASSVLTAYNNSSKEYQLPVTVVSNNVNPSADGVYQVVLSATNPLGKTTRVTVNVTVGNPGKTATVKYRAGYSVNVWSINGNTPVFTGNRTEDGTKVATFDTRTLNGVSYTRVGSASSNTWIQTQYLDGSYKPATKPSTSSNEEKISGVAKVVYNGRGGVKLLNGKGQYQTQVVKNGTSWKVFAKKTINGKTYYRIGNDNQWIPAQYVNFR
ncbi:SLAP domain-containing protein [Lactobacillus hominis]|uniref:SLAP domain-containing protein n=1 Tax=Lactobacillus hominis TaxID=1203033 RepID=UPI0023F48CA2|nr:SLAP domain-containing protein [Lactobacillus hominis]